MSRVVVTGGAGRLGRSVVAVLSEAGHEVHSIDRGTAPDLPAHQTVHDLGDVDSTARLLAGVAPDAVVHLAAIAVPGSAPDSRIFAVNTALAFSVLEGARLAGADRCLVASSPTVVGYGAAGWTPTALPIDESHPLAPWNGYALSKQSIESLVAMTARRHGDAFRVGAFRPCFVVAPEEWAGAPTQQGHTVRQRLEDPALAAVALFNYVDARDAGAFVDAWLAGAARVPNGSVFFTGADDALATRPLAELLPEHVPATAALAGALSGTAPAFSSARARDLLGWRPRRSWRTELKPTEEPSGA